MRTVVLMRTGNGYVNLAAAVSFEVSSGWHPSPAASPTPRETPESFEEYCERQPELGPPDYWTVHAVFTGSEHDEHVELPELRADTEPGAWANLNEFLVAVLNARFYAPAERR